MTEEKPKVEEKEKKEDKKDSKEDKPKTQTKSKPIEAKPLPTQKQKETEKKEEKKEEKPKVDSQEDKKPIESKVEKPSKKKYTAIAKGQNVPISKKQATYICAFIKNKQIDKAISELQNVSKLKQVIPFKGEIPHRRGKGVMSGRYPIKASQYFVNMLKGLKGNVLVNGLDLDKARITIASASWASRPMRRGGRLAKRTNVLLKAQEVKVKGGKK